MRCAASARSTVVLATASILATLACASTHRAPDPMSPGATPATPGPAGTRTVQGVVAMSERFTPRTGGAAIRGFRPDVPPVDSGGECEVAPIGGSGARRVTAFFPTRATSRTNVTLMLDAAGHVVRYLELRGVLQTHVPPGTRITNVDSLFHADFVATRRTNFDLDYAADRAIASNGGGGRPTDAVMGPVRALERLESLGVPAERKEHVRRLCGV